MESAGLNDLIASFPISDTNELEKFRHGHPGVYINETRYLDEVAREVGEFSIGGYHVLHKWLKGRKLLFGGLPHHQRIVVALKEAMRPMEDVDDLIHSPRSDWARCRPCGASGGV